MLLVSSYQIIILPRSLAAIINPMNPTRYGTWLLSFLVFLGLLAFTAPLLAQTEMMTPTSIVSPLATPEIQDTQTTTIEGRALWVSGNMLTLEMDDNSALDVSVPENIAVSRDNSQARVSEIQPGDSVTLVQGSDGRVLSVSAVTGDLIDLGQWALPLLVLGLLAGLVIWWLVSRANSSHIKSG